MDFGQHLTHSSLLVVFAVITAYFVFISFVGVYFSRFSSSINDFFFSGQRFSWWLPAFSMIATGIGSYSYLKYSQQGYDTGMSSTMMYMNEWFVLPVFMFGWLPILYYGRIKSIPEYFEKRFNRTARYVAVFLILAYIFYYIGYNLYTIGLALDGLFGFHPLYTIPFITCILGFYVTFGGQTAVILTDLFQGVMLYLVGFLVAGFGLYALGGLEEFWSYLPMSHRLPFTSLNTDPYFNAVGVFWGDAVIGNLAFLLMNQGILMRFLATRSMRQARIAVMFNVLVCLPFGAITVGVAGWIAKSIITKQAVIGGALPGHELLTITNSYHVFINVIFNLLKEHEMLLGFVVAALLAALMSTVDTLINASAAIGVYDIYKPLSTPGKSDKHYLRVARIASLCVIAISLLLVVWFFRQKGTLMAIHNKGIMTIVPPVVATALMGIFWRGYRAKSAVLSMVIGSLAVILSGIFPQPVMYLRSFFMGNSVGDPIYFRALFGVLLTAIVGVVLNAWFRKCTQDPKKNVEGLTVGTIDKAIFSFKGGEPNYAPSPPVRALSLCLDEEVPDGRVALSKEVGKKLKANIGDMIYVSDNRRFLGGFRSGHFKLHSFHNKGVEDVVMSQNSLKRSYMLAHKKVFVEKTI